MSKAKRTNQQPKVRLPKVVKSGKAFARTARGTERTVRAARRTAVRNNQAARSEADNV